MRMQPVKVVVLALMVLFVTAGPLLAAHEDKVLAMSTVTLREECGSWWPGGFAATTDDEFRALLEDHYAKKLYKRLRA